ncbi:HlyD family secretion protein, partial [Sphingomonas bacterium]|uniref:HlyD family secretion protein n=1 Tax=Sphingomonas bacterium TaxID=1895847 RepID=UPI001576C049
MARAQLAASEAQVAGARHQIAYYDAQVRSGHAQVDAARAQLAANLVNVGAATVTSRIDGRIGDRTVRVGQYIQAGTRMMTVVPVYGLYLTANFKETQIGLMRIGQPATIEVDALPGEDIHGTVESFSPGTGSRFALVPTDNATGNFTKIVQRVPVRIRVEAGPEARKVLVPGLSVTVSIDTRGAKDDAQAQKDEKKRTEDARKHEHDRELQRDRANHSAGAGR